LPEEVYYLPDVKNALPEVQRGNPAFSRRGARMSAMAVSVTSAVILIAVLLWAISVYNGLVRLSKMKEEAWRGMDVLLKRRFELVLNLVEIVKDGASGERNAFKEADDALASVSSASSPDDRIEAENALADALKDLSAVAEARSDLGSNAVFAELRSELASLENEIQLARRYYDGAARDFNGAIRAFPAALISSRLGYAEAATFGTEDEPSVEEASATAKLVP
jgi:LemA protein